MELVTPNCEHVAAVLAGLRASDRAELYALGLDDAAQALASCLAASSSAWSMLYQGEAVALTGVCPNADGSGAPWLVGTNMIRAAPLAFMRASARALKGYRGLFVTLANYVEAGQRENVRYVKALGFTLGERRRIGRGEFYKFYME